VVLTALALTSTGLLAPGLVTSASASTPAASVAAAVAPALAVPCVAKVPATPGRFQHDDLDVTPAVARNVQRQVSLQTTTTRARANRTGAATLPARISVPVQIHVIRGSHKKDRVVTRKAARRLFYTLRAGYAGRQDPTMTPTGITFTLAAITVSRKDKWFHASPGSKADRDMHRKLHRGKRRVLNIYLNDATSDGGALLGIARFPWLAGPYPKLDGVTINVQSLPGGRARGYNSGDTVIHEVGHWFGLFHTFEGGCETPGDYIADTPAEAEPSFQCQKSRDTCPTDLPAGWTEGDPVPAAEKDPVTNFMDYSYDSCMNHFTPDQRIRAVTLFLRYRAGR
jgi:hypothetical protein